INGIYLVDTTGAVEVGDLNTTPAVSDTAYHDYRLVRAGSTLTAYIDGTEYLSVTDDALGTEGGIGMGSYNDIALFDDFAEGEGPSAVNELIQTNFKIYPNPAGDYLNVDADNIIQELVITNIIGQEMLTIRDIGSRSTLINTTGFKNGIYFITVCGIDGSPSTDKFIKK
ncbi:MAG: T9SS type A sorting domain-containing protein, partial [Bacteroidales bacterium]